MASQKALNEQREGWKDQKLLGAEPDSTVLMPKNWPKRLEQTASQSLLERKKLSAGKSIGCHLEHERLAAKTLSNLEKERDQVQNQLLLQRRKRTVSSFY